MELRERNFIKATVNGKKAGFVVYHGSIWLLSYTRAWDSPDLAGYASVPKHGFFFKTIVGLLAYDTDMYTTFQEWRDYVLQNVSPTRSSLTSIAFPGEDGYDREICRRRANRESEEAQPEADPAPTEETPQEVSTGPDIDFFLPNYSTDHIYQGLQGYHNSHRSGFLNQPAMPFSGHRIGVELEVEANSSEFYNEIVGKSSNWFTREHDGSLNSLGIEFITVPLLPDDAKSYQTWQPLCTYLKNKAKAWDSERCGLHVHIGREILGDTEDERQMTLGKILIFYQGDVESWIKATTVFGRQRCYNQSDGNTDEIKAVKCLGMGVLKDPNVFAKVDTAMKTKFGSDRYYAVNLQNRHTLEFRKGRGSINADRIIAVVTMTEAICLFAKETQPQDLTLDNFQEWLFLNVPCGNPLFRYLNIRQADV